MDEDAELEKERKEAMRSAAAEKSDTRVARERGAISPSRVGARSALRAPKADPRPALRRLAASHDARTEPRSQPRALATLV